MIDKTILDMENENNIMSTGFFSIKVNKKILILGGLLISLVSAFIFLSFSTPFLINLLGSALNIRSGIVLRAEGFKLRSGLRGKIDNLYIKGGNGLSVQTLLKRVEFDGGIGEGLRPEITDLAVHNPNIQLEINPNFARSAASRNDPLNPSGIFSGLSNLLRKISHIKRLEIQGGTFFLRFPEETGELKITDTRVEIRDKGQAGGSLISLEGMLHFHSLSSITSLPGRFKLSFDTKSSLPVLLGDGQFSISFPEFSIGAAKIKYLFLEGPILINKDKILLPEWKFGLKGFENEDGSIIKALSNLMLQASVSYDLQSGALNVTSIKAEVPSMGTMEGDLDIELLNEYSWEASFSGKEILLDPLPELIAPFIKPDQRGWFLNGRGGINVKLRGKRGEGQWGINGILEIKAEGVGFSSPDGTKAGDGINLIIVLDVIYPQKQGDRGSLKTNGRIEGGEYLWGTFYRDMSDHSLTWDSQGFFLRIFKNCNSTLS